MMPSSPPPTSLSLAAAILTALIASSSHRACSSFQTSPRMMPIHAPRLTATVTTTITTTSVVGDRRRHRASPLYSVVDMPMRPMEEEREKKNSDDHHHHDENDDENDGVEGDDDRRGGEWKQVVGGFVPKFLKRRMGVEAAAAAASSSSDAVDARPTILAIDTLEEYKRVVVDERESMVVVRFHAPWCKSCKAAYPHFSKLASDYHHGGRSYSSVKFVEVPLTKETAYIHEGLGVPSVPFGHIYHPDVGLVEERKINRKEFGEFRSALESYVRGCCYLPEEEEGEDDGAERRRRDGDDAFAEADDEFQ